MEIIKWKKYHYLNFSKRSFITIHCTNLSDWTQKTNSWRNRAKIAQYSTKKEVCQFVF